MTDAAYRDRVSRIETYFDRTAVRAWEQMTSDAPLGRIRATVRAGRDQMRAEILAMLPVDMTGLRLLDAGCGTGALSVEAAARGADVVAVDISPKLVAIASQRAPESLAGRLDFRVGDLADPAIGRFDHVVAMDVLIHYSLPQATATLASLARRADRSLLFTFAPKTPTLAAMHAVGRLFPRGDRSPAIEPVWESSVRSAIEAEPALGDMRQGRTVRVKSGFYISQVLELTRALGGSRR
ncbi:magnesium protoporphyrin IX methyltransferase [Methylopila turkensis]|uniref:Magnesium protoporphyrin IX methyltransferase n=1 Tax=Methylopila turkensis TaxID=1437816 RepID=A0A9W6JM09_9HYPH|nr:magnesium protoporphyrin IX methyltransferase [Methylopila turkensis]GLK78290.1 magnesium protoporphyrin IX methyltransferase [Methylopila turkensis]